MLLVTNPTSLQIKDFLPAGEQDAIVRHLLADLGVALPLVERRTLREKAERVADDTLETWFGHQLLSGPEVTEAKTHGLFAGAVLRAFDSHFPKYHLPAFGIKGPHVWLLAAEHFKKIVGETPPALLQFDPTNTPIREFSPLEWRLDLLTTLAEAQLGSHGAASAVTILSAIARLEKFEKCFLGESPAGNFKRQNFYNAPALVQKHVAKCAMQLTETLLEKFGVAHLFGAKYPYEVGQRVSAKLSLRRIPVGIEDFALHTEFVILRSVLSVVKSDVKGGDHDKRISESFAISMSLIRETERRLATFLEPLLDPEAITPRSLAGMRAPLVGGVDLNPLLGLPDRERLIALTQQPIDQIWEQAKALAANRLVIRQKKTSTIATVSPMVALSSLDGLVTLLRAASLFSYETRRKVGEQARLAAPELQKFWNLHVIPAESAMPVKADEHIFRSWIFAAASCPEAADLRNKIGVPRYEYGRTPIDLFSMARRQIWFNSAGAKAYRTFGSDPCFSLPIVATLTRQSLHARLQQYHPESQNRERVLHTLEAVAASLAVRPPGIFDLSVQHFPLKPVREDPVLERHITSIQRHFALELGHTSEISQRTRSKAISIAQSIYGDMQAGLFYPQSRILHDLPNEVKDLMRWHAALLGTRHVADAWLAHHHQERGAIRREISEQLDQWRSEFDQELFYAFYRFDTAHSVRSYAALQPFLKMHDTRKTQLPTFEKPFSQMPAEERIEILKSCTEVMTDALAHIIFCYRYYPSLPTISAGAREQF